MNFHETKSFTSAFLDLGERLRRAVETLEVMSYSPRRAAKLDGLESALVAYDEIAKITGSGPEAWREFTDRILAAYIDRFESPVDEVRLSAAGFALALEYQRGYGTEIDVAPLHILLATQGVTARP